MTLRGDDGRDETHHPERPARSGRVSLGGPRAGRSWRDRAVDLAVLFGLAGIAVTQPVLDLFGPNPTFFVAGNYSRAQIVGFALVIAVVPALVVFAVTAPASLIGPRCARASHALGVALLAGLFGLALSRTLGVESTVAAFALAVVFGVAVAVAEWRVTLARRFLSYLALGNAAFVVLFLVGSPSAELLGGAAYADAGRVKVPELHGPVVVVVLDEFPLPSLIDGDGNIIEERYPNIAGLAAEATWFRNAAAESKATFASVPTILSGVRAGKEDLPTYQDHPRNLFTLFEAQYPSNRYEIVTELCPPDTCTPPPGQPLTQALEDASVVYRHRVLPEDLRDGLPAIDRSWGNFGDDLAAEPVAPAPASSFDEDPMARLDEVPKGDRGRVGQAQALRRQVALLDREPSINLIHVLLPHHPYQLTPWGTINADRWIPQSVPGDPDDPGYDWAFREAYAMQALQVGAVDQMIGEMVDHLKDVGAWRDALLVVTSDHGIDISPPGVGRVPSPESMDELFRVPLFIKAPGQTTGEIRDEPASTVDVLPSIVDLLNIETEWTFEGHSLFDGSEPTIERVVTSDVEAAFDVARRHLAKFPHGLAWDDLAAVGEGADLLGRPVTDFEVGDPSDLAMSHEHGDLLADLSAESGQVPYWLRGSLTGSDTTPPELAVAVNGTFAGTIGGYRPEDDGSWRFSGLLTNEFVDGANDVVAYEVERTDGRVVLHEVAST